MPVPKTTTPDGEGGGGADNIRHLLDLSTLHVPGPEPDWGDLKVTVHEYGWVVWVYDPDDSLSPEWMKPIMKLAYQKNCALILFDADAPEWEGTELHRFETFEKMWSADEGEA